MNVFKARLLSVFILVCLLAALPVSHVRAAPKTYRVKPTGLTSGSCGGSWSSTCGLQRALSLAIAGDQLWVVAGTYKPTSGTDRTISFALESGVAIYGGFAGTETGLDQRNPDTNITILSGEIGAIGNSDNSYHVVVGSGTDSTATLDGFTITGGNADGAEPSDRGGGILVLTGSPTLANLKLVNNQASSRGGGLYNTGSPMLDNITFSGNRTGGSGHGGGMYNTGSPTLTNVIFNRINPDDNTSGNWANVGGGLYNTGDPILTDVIFSGNDSANAGGIYNIGGNPTLMNVTFSGNSTTNYGGGMFSSAGNPNLTNVTFRDNSAPGYGGGGMYVHAGNPTLTNVTFHANSSNTGGGIFVNSGGLIILNTILWGNTATTGDGPQVYQRPAATSSISYSVVQGGCPMGSSCMYILNADPLLGTFGNYGGFTETIPLLRGSPAINAGNDTAEICPATDQRGMPRPQSTHCDIGAYEFEPGILYVKEGTGGINDGASWASAYSDLQSALAVDIGGDEIWVAAGTYKPTTAPVPDPTDRAKSFTLENGVDVYGGFVGGETLLSQRNSDPATNNTVLSGDIGAAGNSDNSYHVVVDSNTNSTAILDGFTITGGNANSSDPDLYGGGMFILSGSPTLRNIIFSNNRSDSGGGGLYNAVGSPALTNVTFSSNSSVNGGGMYTGYGSPTLTDVSFDSNHADSSGKGGGMYDAGGSPTLTNVIFSGNTALLGMGGGLYSQTLSTPSMSLTDVTISGNTAANGGGVFNNSANAVYTNVTVSGNTATVYGGGMYTTGSPALTNITFSGNTAVAGGGISIGVGNPTLTNVTFKENTATNNLGGAIENSSGNAIVRNIIAWGNTPSLIPIYDVGTGLLTISDSVVQGGCPAESTCTNIITADPLLGTLGNYGGFTQTIPLDDGSPAIDAGSDCTPADQRGLERPQDGNNDGVATCDIGAYEAEFIPGVGMYDDIDALWDYSAGWTALPGSGAHDGTLHRTSTNGATATFDFRAPAFFTYYYRMGPNRGTFEIWVDGVLLKAINANSTSVVWQKQYTSPAYTDDDPHTVVIKNTSPDGTYIDVDAIELTLAPAPSGPALYEDDDLSWLYSAGWSQVNGSGASGGTLHRTSTKSTTATFVLQAPAFFTVYYRKGPNFGPFQILVDGVKLTTIDAYSAATVWQKQYTSPAYTDGKSHTVVIRSISPDGTYVDVDAIEITPAPVPSGPGMYDDIDPAWIYSPGWTADPGSGAHDGTLHRTVVKNSTATFVFQAPAVFTFYYRKGPNRGSLEVWVDGVLLKTLNANSTSVVWQKTYVSPAYTDDKSHTIVIRNINPAGTYIDVDAIQIE